MASYTKIPSPEIEAILDAALRRIGAEIGELRLPKLTSVVLGGGYGRGEGGVHRTDDGDRLYNDLDLFAFSEGAGRSEMRRISEALTEIAERWTPRLGVAVDISPVKELSSLRRLSGKLMYQELVRGWKPVWGKVDLDAAIPRRPPEALPFSEAARLILNRGMGLVLAGERLTGDPSDVDFIMRNMQKSQQGGGDALLIAAGKYRWNSEERLAALREYVAECKLPSRITKNYERALHYKSSPDPRLPGDPTAMWHDCRECLLEAARHVAGCAADAPVGAVLAGLHRRAAAERSLRNFLRWTLRAGAFRPPVCAFDPPEVSVAGMLYRHLAVGENPSGCPPLLYRLWCKFN